jgi:hypothetical protein
LRRNEVVLRRNVNGHQQLHVGVANGGAACRLIAGDRLMVPNGSEPAVELGFVEGWVIDEAGQWLEPFAAFAAIASFAVQFAATYLFNIL